MEKKEGDVKNLGKKVTLYPNYVPIYGTIKNCLVDAEELLGQDIKAPESILPPFVYDDTIVSLYGPRGTGKTMLALTMAIAATREPGSVVIGPWSATKAVKTIYIDGEMGRFRIKDRYSRLTKYLPKPVKQLTFLSDEMLTKQWVDGISLNLSDPEIKQVIYDICVSEKYNLVILDNMSKLLPYVDINKKEELDSFNNWLISFRHAGIAVIVLDHTGKNQKLGALGSIAKQLFMDCTLQLSFPKGWTPADRCFFKVSIDKPPRYCENDIELSEFTLKYQQNPEDPDSTVWTSEVCKVDPAKLVKALIIDIHSSKLSFKEIAKIGGLSSSRVSQIKKELFDNGYVDEYGLPTNKGNEFIKDIDLKGYYKKIDDDVPF